MSSPCYTFHSDVVQEPSGDDVYIDIINLMLLQNRTLIYSSHHAPLNAFIPELSQSGTDNDYYYDIPMQHTLPDNVFMPELSFPELFLKESHDFMTEYMIYKELSEMRPPKTSKEERKHLQFFVF